MKKYLWLFLPFLLGATYTPNPLPVEITEPLNVTGLVTVDGTLTGITNTVNVDGSATVQPVSGTLDIAQPVTVDGTLTGITNTVTVTGDSGGSLTVDSSQLDIDDLNASDDVVTANLSATDNAVLDTIDAVLDTIKTDTVAIESDLGSVVNVAQPVTVDGTLTGITNTVTVTGDAAGSLTVDNAGLTELATAIDTQMQVDIVADGAGLLTTSAHDAAFGTAGSADTQVRSVQGIGSGTPVIVTGDSAGSLTVDGTVTVTDGAGALNVIVDSGTLTTVSTVTAVTDITNPVEVDGTTAHDAAATSVEPVLVGGYAIDYHPDAEDEQGRSEVGTDEDASRIALNRRGEVMEGVNGFYHLFDGTFPDTGLDGIYDDSPTSSTSESVEAWNYRYATVGLCIDSTSTPTDIQIQVQGSVDGGTVWFDIKNGALGQWIYDDTFVATEKCVSYMFEIAYTLLRVDVTATGTDASNTFTVDDSFIYLRN